MNKKISYTLAVLMAGMLVFVLLLVSKPKPAPVDDAAIPAPLVDVVVVSPSARALSVKTQGTIKPRREIDLITRVSGTVESVAPAFAAGGFIDSGQQLLAIDDSDYRFALIRAEARVAEAAQLLATEKGRAYQAKREWRDLGNEEGNALFLRKPQLASAEAAYLAAQADRDQARLDLERTHMTAPFNGRIRETYVDLGQYVNAGTKAARLYSTDVVEVRLPLTDRQLSLLDLPYDYHHVEEGQDQVVVTLSATVSGREWQWPAYITRTDASIDVESRVVYAVAEVPSPFEREPGSERPPLSIGQFVTATIQGRQIDDVVVLPRKALRPERKIWLLDDKQQLLPVAVQLLYSDGEQVVVRGEFGEQARVIVSALSIPVVGMPLSLRNADGVAGVVP